MRAEIYLEDDGDQVAARFNFGASWDKDSRAHQLANIIRMHLDSICEREDAEKPAQPLNS